MGFEVTCSVLTSGTGETVGACESPFSTTTSSDGLTSWILGLESTTGDVSDELASPTTGDATRELAILGSLSLFAARAALSRFSASSLAMRSCSSAAVAEANRVECSIGRMICMQIGAQMPYFSPSSARVGTTFCA